MDGLTGAIQERMKNEYQSKSGHMMLSMNKWSVGYLLVGQFLAIFPFSFASFDLLNLLNVSQCNPETMSVFLFLVRWTFRWRQP